MNHLSSRRCGATLIELLMFIAIIGVVMTVTFPLLFTSTETRMLQQTIAVTEHNGTQAIQNIALRIRDAEAVLLPAAGGTGSVLALQLDDADRDPVIVGVSSGILIIVEGIVREEITSEQVAVKNFVARTVDTGQGPPSVTLSFDVERTIRLQQPKSYERHFEATVRLFPDDVQEGNPCGCPLPACLSADAFSWQVCQADVCNLAQTHLECTVE